MRLIYFSFQLSSPTTYGSGRYGSPVGGSSVSSNYLSVLNRDRSGSRDRSGYGSDYNKSGYGSGNSKYTFCI